MMSLQLQQQAHDQSMIVVPPLTLSKTYVRLPGPGSDTGSALCPELYFAAHVWPGRGQ